MCNEWYAGTAIKFVAKVKYQNPVLKANPVGIVQTAHSFTSTVRDIQTCLVSFSSIFNFKEFLIKNAQRIAVIIDEKLLELWRTDIELLFNNPKLEVLRMIPVSEGESCKRLDEYLRVIELLQNLPIERRDTLVVIGGGACCDMGGVVAATFMRGIPYILVPTTLMAMVDAAFGGKVAINLPAGKNLFGSFHTPVGVWVNTDFLRTLPDREIRQAIGEVIKIALISDDPEFFENLETFSQRSEELFGNKESLKYLIYYSIKYKLDQVEKDWKEVELDRLLNAGHEVAHSLEKTFEFEHSTLAHGEAVALGLAACTRFSSAKGFISSGNASRIIQLIKGFGLPTFITLSPAQYEKAAAALNIQRRVRNGDLRLVLPEMPYRSFVYHGADAPQVLDYLGME